ncbi:MAG: hypothetical protein H0U45_02785, partial [Tatlockia sp.]|nr:hypothetical protein [Tatlockia sp.]
MTLSYPLKNYSWQQIARPMLLLSIGIHGLLLFTPIPTKKAELIQKDKIQNKVKITQLPISSNSPRVIKKPSNSIIKSSIIRQTNRPLINQQKSINQAVIKKFPQLASKPENQKSQIASTPAETIALPNPNSLNDPFSDFPKYINSQPGLGLFTAPIDQSSQQTQDSVTTVSQYFERELKAREYKITIAKNEANAKVFELKKGNTTKFLNLITHNSKTVIVLASEILNPENINDVAKASPEEEAFISILNKIEFETIDQPELYLSEPGLFYTKFGADKDGFLEMEQKSNTISTIRLIPNQLPEQVFNTIFAPTLKTSNFEINPQKKYGGGMVYEVKQGNFVTYLNLVPTSD